MHTSSFDRQIDLQTHPKTSASSGLLRKTVFSLAGFLAAALPVVAQQVPAVVASTQTTLASGLSSGPAAVDACGNVYINQNTGNAGVVQISAATGAVTVVAANKNGYNGSDAIYIDRAKKYLYIAEPHDQGTTTGNSGWYSSEFTQIPIGANCALGTLNQTFGNSDSYLFGYYYGTAGDITGDAAGDVFYTNTQGSPFGIVEDVYNASTATYTGKLIYSSSAYLDWIASDAAGNIYFNDGSKYVYYLPAPYTAAPVKFGTGFQSVSGLSFDSQNNLYVADSSKGVIYEFPAGGASNEPVAANMFAVASVGAPDKVAVDAYQNIDLSNYYPGAVQIKRGSATAPGTSLGSTSASFAINYIFNASVTPTAFSAVTGTAASPIFSPGTGGCAVGTAYAALSTCSLYATFTPSAIGEQTGAIEFTSASGTVTTQVSGIGKGAAITIDPGTVAPTATTLTAPTGIAVDNLGNVYVTDATANTLTEFPAGSNGVGTTVSTGTVSLKAPHAVAIDNLGNIFIADTGNNRVVEIPVIGTTLTNSSTAAVALTLKNPEGVATDGAGNLYVADTGDNELVFVPNIGGALSFASATENGTALNGPSAVAVDPNGNVYVTETGNNDLLQFPAPLGSSAQVKVATGLNAPSAVATDASGSVYVVDSGSGSIFHYPNVGGNLLSKTLAGSTIANPTAVAVDAYGNLYATDQKDDVVAEIARVTTALQFGGWNVSSTSTPLSATVSNSGNVGLTFHTPSYTAGGNTGAGFAVTGDTCAGSTQLPGGSCTLTATFTPTALELNAQENLAFASNAQNGTPTLQLVGTGAQTIASTLTLALTSPANATSVNAGQSVTFTATADTAGNVPVPGGTVKFYVSGNLVGSVATANGVAALSLPNGLPSGNAVVVSAVYGGTVVNGTKYYSGSTAQVTEDVIALPDTLTLTITSEWTSPASENDNVANAKGPSIPLIATVVPSAATIPTGTVTFYAGTTTLGIAQVTPTSGGAYQAILNTTALRAGTTTQVEDGSYITTYSISAVYSGDNRYYSSTSASQSISLVAGPATLPACATASPATCYANTTGAFFTLTPANPTITASTSTTGGPGSGSTTMSITSYGGWNGILNFTCSGLPAYATCAPYPGYPNGQPNTTTPIDFIINTNVAPTPPNASSTVWWISGLAGLAMLLMRRRIKRMGYAKAGQLFTLAGAALLLGGSAVGMSGCGGTQAYGYITPAGSSTVTVKVSAAQLIPNAYPVGATYLPDTNTSTFQITLVVK